MSEESVLGESIVVVQYGTSQRDAIDNSLKIVRQPIPRHGVDGVTLYPGDVVVRVFATEIVWTDTVMATGQYQHRARIPYSPGMTYAGVVAYVHPGDPSSTVSVGDAVAMIVVRACDSLSQALTLGPGPLLGISRGAAVRRTP